MRLTLQLHPDSSCTAATKIDVQITRPSPGNLDLCYVVTGKMSHLLVPPPAAAGRGDELWHHTCFEAFVRASPGTAYYEFNFSPSLEWAAYQFDDYRAGMSIVSEISEPRVEAFATEETYNLKASLELDRLPNLPDDADWCLGVSAIIEETSGQKSYWALAHPRGKPDFHTSEGFVHKIGATT